MVNHCRCPMKCFSKFTDDEKLIMFNKLYQLETKDEQDIYLQGLIEKQPVARKRVRNVGGNNRAKSFYHFVSHNQQRVKVCLGAFLSLHAVTVKRVKRLKRLLESNTTPRDNRGKNVKSNCLPECEIKRIREHIESFPVKETHYSNRDYYYLNSTLNVKIMYELFMEKYPDSKIKYSYYIKYFNENFSLHFGRPQVDTCITCETLNLKIQSPTLGEAAKKAAEAELAVHKRRAKKFYKMLNKTTAECKKKDSAITAIAFDYMQNVHLPEVPVQDLFYAVQLNVNVFCIHDIGSGKAFYYIYHEGEANKGPDEVCSFLLDYINNVANPESKELRLFCDNCPGQNKNHPLIKMCMALAETKRFDKVLQYYPFRGHSFLPCDRDFGVIKRKLKKFDRIFLLHQYTEIIIRASAGRNFTVKEVSTQEILNFKDWWPTYYKKSICSLESKSAKKTKKENFMISNYHYFEHDSKTPGIVKASALINSFMVDTFPLKKPKNNTNSIIKMPTARAYAEDRVPILHSKIKHLQNLVTYVPEKYQDFYYNIINTWPTKLKLHE